MAFTQPQLDALEEAIAQGALTVKYQDKEVTYRSLSDMMKIRDLIRQKLGSSVAVGRVYPVTSKGLDK